jgi:hypothetical protein
MPRILLMIIVFVIGGVAIWLGLNKTQTIDVEVAYGQMTTSSSLIDFGDIDQSGGVVSATVEVTNTGLGTLSINRVSTSCGCTTASMDESPLGPGEKRTLTIQFDPMAHPDESGPITRAVYIQTSDPEQPEVEIDVVGNVIPKTGL